MALCLRPETRSNPMCKNTGTCKTTLGPTRFQRLSLFLYLTLWSRGLVFVTESCSLPQGHVYAFLFCPRVRCATLWRMRPSFTTQFVAKRLVTCGLWLVH
eukprot:jgi/Botrbrau1/21105/Bobra.0791s0003.1